MGMPASEYDPLAMDQVQMQQALSAFVTKVFGWMTAGLMITAVAALGTANSEAMLRLIYGNPVVLIVLILAELGLVIGLSAGINKLSPGAASAMFVIYSALNGLVLSVVFLVYTAASLTSTFFVTGGVFGVMYAYGHVTKKDLTGLGSLCFMGLIGVILASIVNMFVASSGLDWAISIIGVLVFVGLTAYDAQKIKMIGLQSGQLAEGTMHKAAVMGALRLYLDFINLFLLLLRFMGRRR